MDHPSGFTFVPYAPGKSNRQKALQLSDIRAHAARVSSSARAKTMKGKRCVWYAVSARDPEILQVRASEDSTSVKSVAIYQLGTEEKEFAVVDRPDNSSPWREHYVAVPLHKLQSLISRYRLAEISRPGSVGSEFDETPADIAVTLDWCKFCQHHYAFGPRAGELTRRLNHSREFGFYHV